ncbi:MAG: hypothetical protein WCA76_01430 [Candidatus Sulfotelmatobacter sp.]|jgi:hypothetical protein
MATIETRKDTRKNNSRKHSREHEEWNGAKKVGRSKQTWVSDSKTIGGGKWVSA